MTKQVFATPRSVRFEDCDFYHTVEVPGHGIVHGQWDLRGRVDEYLGHYQFTGKRVLEIGPASGFLTFEMERRGADVVALEVPDDPGWDFVPFPDEMMAPIFEPRRVGMNKIKNSFWFLHGLHGSQARLCYGDSSNLPDLGRFDAAVMASVLLHCERPPRIIAECAKRVDTLIVTDVYKEDLEGSAVCRLVPNATRFTWDTWWEFSTTFFEQFLGVLGFPHIAVTRHEQVFNGHGPTPFFTVIGSRHAIADITSLTGSGIENTSSGGVVSGVVGSGIGVSGGDMINRKPSPQQIRPRMADIPIPPPELRHRVTGSDSADVFLTSGQLSYGDLTRALAGAGRQLGSFERVLDWGCGCGRVTRWLGAELEGRELFGVDIDPLAIGWCARHLPFGQFMVCEPRPPLDFPDNHFDLVINHSVLTHLDASMQHEWLAELRRITRPGGLIILSTHGDGAFATLAADWATERAAERRKVLETVGFLHVTEDYVGSPFPDFYQNTFHATWYVFTHWAKHFPILAYYPRGALSFQDIVVLKHPASDDKTPNSPIVPARNGPAAAGESSPSGPPRDRERLQGLVDEGPPLNQPSRYGVLTRLVRRIMRRATANLHAHQQDIDRRLILALGDLERTVSRLDYGQLMLRDGLTRQSERIARLENQVTEQLEGSTEDGSATTGPSTLPCPSGEDAGSELSR
jgi:SAM-dependent methyltransferase